MPTFILFLLATCSAGLAAVPAWVSEFATASHPAYPGKMKAVVLFNEEKVIAEATGRQASQIRKVIKILTADGHREAMGAFTYDQAGGKVREARAYLLYPTGKTKEFNRKEFIEGESNSGLYLYSSRKFLRQDGSKEADPGSVFAYEVTMEEKRVYSQFYFLLQDYLPTLKSRFQLTIPVGWSVLAKAYGGARFTQEDFPSPHQFNHAILAIAVPKETNLPSTVDDADLGRLLIFDPTDAYVAFGYLPTHEQGAWALLTADEKGKLLRRPQAAEGTNRVERTWTMSLQADGSLAGQLVEKTWGQDAFDHRQLSEDSGEENYREALERWLSNAVPGMAIEKLEYRFDPQANTFDTHLRFTAPSYAKVMRGKLWMARERHFHETLTCAFPAQLKIDEVPGNESAERPYGRFATTWKAEDGAMRLERTLVLKETLLPPADYAAARGFFGQFRSAEAAPVVLLAR